MCNDKSIIASCKNDEEEQLSLKVEMINLDTVDSESVKRYIDDLVAKAKQIFMYCENVEIEDIRKELEVGFTTANVIKERLEEKRTIKRQIRETIKQYSKQIGQLFIGLCISKYIKRK